MSTDTALVPRDPPTVPVAPDALSGGSKGGLNVRPSKLGLRIPPLALIHKVETRDQIDQGQLPGAGRYGTKQSMRILEAPRAVFLRVDEVRRYSFEENGKLSTVCASADGLVPYPAVEAPPALRCDQCPRAQWHTDKARRKADGRFRRIPPDCDEGLGFLGVLPDHGNAPFWLTLFGTGYRAARDVVAFIQADPDSRNVHEIVFVLGTKETRSDAGAVYYLPAIAPLLDRLAPAVYGAMAAVAADVTWEPFVMRSEDDGDHKAEPAPPDHDAPMPRDEDPPF